MTQAFDAVVVGARCAGSPVKVLSGADAQSSVWAQQQVAVPRQERNSA
jgi:hypothetical protein